MIEKASPTKQLLIDCLKTYYDIDVSRLTRLPLGADIDASVYEAQARNQSSYFVKLKCGDSQNISIDISELLHTAGIQHIIPLIKTTQGQPTHRMGDFTLMVFPFVKGQNGFSRNLSDEQWYMLGKVMRQIHEITVPSSLQTKIRRETYSSKWREAVRALYPLMESEPSGDRVAVNFQEFMKKHAATIHRLVDRAEDLAQKAQNESAPFVLCHSDIHGGNILIDEKDTFYIVDWDDPIMAPKERDLMFIGGGVGNIWNKPHEEELFYRGYGKTELNKTLLAYYRHERIIEDIAVYGQQLLLTTEGGQDRIEWYNQFLAQFEPQGVVEIAFKTDRPSELD